MMRYRNTLFLIFLLGGMILYWLCQFPKKEPTTETNSKTIHFPTAAVPQPMGVTKDNPPKGATPEIKEKIDLKSQIQSIVALREFNQAKEILEAQLRENPSNVNALIELGFLYVRQLDAPNKAKVLFHRTLLHEPNQGEVLHELVELYQATQTLKEGESFLRGHTAQNKEAWAARIAYGDLLIRQGNHSTAIDYLEHEATHSPYSDKVLPYLGKAYFEAGEYDKAVEVFATSAKEQEALQEGGLTPQKRADISRLDLANSLFAKEETTKAEQIVEEVLTREPSHPFGKALKAAITKRREEP